jgi:formiminotetrahydrofolate cyclodeaminase
VIPDARGGPTGEGVTGAGASPGWAFETIDAFLTELASGSPLPGGGAAAALTGALAAALVGMVCRVAAGRDPSAPGRVEVAAAADELGRRLMALMREDVAAYGRVLEVGGLPADGRAAALGPALVNATDVPLEVGKCTERVLALCDAVVQRAPSRTLGDLGVAASLAWAALEAGSLTARINLRDISDERYVRASLAELNRLAVEGAALRERISKGIAERV